MLQISNTGYIYVCDYNANKLTFLLSTGEVMYLYDNIEVFRPTDIYVDHPGNITVCGFGSRNIHIITASGKKHRILLTSSDGIYLSYSVAYRQSDATLIIGSWNSNNLLVVKLEN